MKYQDRLDEIADELLTQKHEMDRHRVVLYLTQKELDFLCFTLSDQTKIDSGIGSNIYLRIANQID